MMVVIKKINVHAASSPAVHLACVIKGEVYRITALDRSIKKFLRLFVEDGFTHYLLVNKIQPEEYWSIRTEAGARLLQEQRLVYRADDLVTVPVPEEKFDYLSKNVERIWKELQEEKIS